MEKRHISFPPNAAKKIKLDNPNNIGEPLPTTSNEDAFDDIPWNNEWLEEVSILESQVCEEFSQRDAPPSTAPRGQGSSGGRGDEPLRQIADYVMGFKPALTSTQKTVVCHSGTFKAPQTNQFQWKAPAHQTTTNVESNKLHIVHDPGHTLHELQGAMIKLERLQYEHSQLQDSLISKEGEVGILRSQLRSAQSQVNAERIQKLKMEERKTQECNEKVNNVEKELRDAKTKMEFQDLEISKLKEKCRMLEKGSKIKLTQPCTQTPKPKWPSVKTNHQDVNKTIDAGQHFKLKVDTQKDHPLLRSIPESVYRYEPVKHIPIEYKSNREPLFVEHSSYIDIRRRILEEFKSDSKQCERTTSNLSLTTVGKSWVGVRRFQTMYQDLSALGRMSKDELTCNDAIDCAIRICKLGKEYLIQVLNQLHTLSRKVSPQTVMEMNQVYLDYMTNNPDAMTTKCLFNDRCWCECEQGIEARRVIAVVSKLCLHISRVAEMICGMVSERSDPEARHNTDSARIGVNGDSSGEVSNESFILDLGIDICKKIEHTGCSQKYPGLLAALSTLVQHCLVSIRRPDSILSKIFEFCKWLLLLRPNGRCVVDVAKILEDLCHRDVFLRMLCKNNTSNSSNAVIEFSQGVLLYSVESCVIQVLCTQVEVWSTHMSCERMSGAALARVTASLVNVSHAALKSHVDWATQRQDNKCSCAAQIYQCITVCLHQTAKHYVTYQQYYNDDTARLVLEVLSCGLTLLKSCTVKDPDFVWKLRYNDGHYQMYIQLMTRIVQDGVGELTQYHKDILTDLTGLISNTDNQRADSPSQLWEETFQAFLITD